MMIENLRRLVAALCQILKRYYLIFLFTGLALMLFTNRYQLAVNVTESLTGSIFLIDKSDKKTVKGEFIAFAWNGAPPIPNGITVIKRVTGITGDKIAVRNRFVFVNGESVGRAKELSRTGNALAVVSEGVIPHGYFFAAGDHPDSFDSRYNPPGLIANRQIKGRAYLLW